MTFGELQDRAMKMANQIRDRRSNRIKADELVEIVSILDELSMIGAGGSRVGSRAFYHGDSEHGPIVNTEPIRNL